MGDSPAPCHAPGVPSPPGGTNPWDAQQHLLQGVPTLGMPSSISPSESQPSGCPASSSPGGTNPWDAHLHLPQGVPTLGMPSSISPGGYQPSGCPPASPPVGTNPWDAQQHLPPGVPPLGMPSGISPGVSQPSRAQLSKSAERGSNTRRWQVKVRHRRERGDRRGGTRSWHAAGCRGSQVAMETSRQDAAPINSQFEAILLKGLLFYTCAREQGLPFFKFFL